MKNWTREMKRKLEIQLRDEVSGMSWALWTFKVSCYLLAFMTTLAFVLIALLGK